MTDSNDSKQVDTSKVVTNGAVRDHRDVTGVFFRVLSITLLMGAVAWILRPFLISIVWAGIIVVTTWPILLWLQARLKNKRGLAVTVMTLSLLLAVVVPLSLSIGVIILKAPEIIIWLKSLTTLSIPPPPKWLSTTPLVGPSLAGAWQQLAASGMKGLGTHLTPYATKAATWFMTKAGTIGMMVLQFLLTVVIAALFYGKGEMASAWILRFASRLGGKHGETVTVLAAKAVRGVVLGVVVTAAVQATVGGIGLMVTGVPAAPLLTAVMFVFCLAQIGPTLILVPSVAWVYWEYGVLWGTILLVFSILAVTLDNFVRPILIRKGADLSVVLILAGVIGGLIAFGIVGLFIGPVVLAVAKTLLDVWVSDAVVREIVSVERGKEISESEPLLL